MTVTTQKTDMVAKVKDWPADSVTRLIEGYALRGVHVPATPFVVEHVLIELSKGVAIRSMRINGRWGRRHEVVFSGWGAIDLYRTR